MLSGTYYGKGEILSLLEEGSYNNKYRFKNEEDDDFLLYIPTDYIINENTIITFTGELELPTKQRNKGGFDYSKYLYSQNIYGSIYISNTNTIEIVEENKFHLISWIQDNIFKILGQVLPKEELGILIGMLIGDTALISEDIEESFQKSGITHLLAVSGSNVAYIILATKTVFQKLIGRNFANYVTIFMVILFVLISGASPSVVRAGIMANILILSEILSRAPDTYSTVATTAIFILLYNPFIICDIGFLLSFGGTLGILFLNQKITETMKNKFPKISETSFGKIVFESLSVTLAAQLFLLPVMWYFFNQISIVSILTNLLVGPFTGIITILGLIVYFIGLISTSIAQVLSYSIYVLISFIIFISQLCSEIPYGTLQFPTPTILFILTYYLVLYLIFSKNNNKGHLKFLVFILVIIQVFFKIFPSFYLEIHMIDVGQGDSMLIQTRHGKNILIDGGGSENSSYDVGEKVLVPYLLDNTNGIIDCMMISHFHEDHAEGCITVLKELKVKQIVIGTQPIMTTLYKEVLKLANEKKIPIITLVAGDCINIDEVKFKVLFPKKEIEIQGDLNNNSMVIKMQYYETSLLLTGDIEDKTEKMILEEDNIKDMLDIDILKVGHHGSQTSSIEDFINKVTPKIALIGVGVNNKFGHPHEIILERLERVNCRIFRTDESGEITLKINKKGTIKVEQKLNV